jgi:hypothetical protein
MAAPVVVVQGLPPAPELRRAVLSACSDALKHRSCISAEEQDRSAPAPLATAVIAWPEGTDRHVRVTLERFDATPNRHIDRDTRFADQDPIIERWRTIGLVIASLVGESETPRDGAAPSEDRPSLALGARPGPRAWLGISALGGPGLDDGSVRLGASVHGALALSSVFFLQTSANYAVRPLDERRLDVRWTTLAVGGGTKTHVPSIDLALRARFELILEYLHASSSAGAPASGGGSRTSPGIRFGGDVLWPAKGALGMTLGFSVWSLPGGTSIQIDQQKVASSRWLSYAGFFGVEWSFR